MAENFTDAVAEVIQNSFKDAEKRRNTEVTENHLLLEFLKNPDDYFSSILSNLQVNLSHLSEEVRRSLEHLPTLSTPSSQAPSPARNLVNRINEAQNIAKEWKDTYTGSDHFLIAY